MSSYSKILDQLRENARNSFFELGLTVANINGLTVDGYKAKRANFENSLQEAQLKTSPGKLRISGDPNDLTIYGKGFFKLKNTQGKNVYLENLRLSLDKNRLLTSGKNIILPETKVPIETKEIKISENGQIEAVLKHGQKKSLGKLQVVNFPREERLFFDGFSYQETKESGTPTKTKLDRFLGTFIKQGAVKTSNTDLPLGIKNFNQIKNKLSTIAQITQAVNTSQREELNSLRQTLQGI